MYMKVPEGVDARPGICCRLIETLYRLKQSGRVCLPIPRDLITVPAAVMNLWRYFSLPSKQVKRDRSLVIWRDAHESINQPAVLTPLSAALVMNVCSCRLLGLCLTMNSRAGGKGSHPLSY